MSEATGAADALVCEYGDCDRPGWVVLHFGPRLTPPLRVACHTHQSESDLGMFRCDRPEHAGVSDE